MAEKNSRSHRHPCTSDKIAPPLVSILIRSNGRAELSDALTSIASQSWPAIEVRVVDVSGAGNVRLPSAYPHALTTVPNDAPLRRSAAANCLLDAAEGELALFLDDDDWLDPDHVARLVASLADHPQAVLAYAGVSCVEACEEQPDITHPADWREVRRYDAQFDPIRLMAENYIPIHAALFRMSAVRQAKLCFDDHLDLFEDWDFWLQCLTQGLFVHCPGVSAYYRIHANAGLGVRNDDEAQAIHALDTLLAKWRQRWSADALRQLIGLARNVSLLQDAIEQAHADAELRLQTAHAAFERERDAEQRRHVAERQAADARHDEALASLRQWYEQSRSWRLTRPLRHLADGLRTARDSESFRKARQQAASALLTTLTAAYRTPWLNALMRRIPPSAKHKVRNLLLRSSIAGSGTAAAPGLRTKRALGDNPRVTIIIPVYNHARFLPRCLRSALAQSWQNLEVVVVDDASPDPEVATILDQFAGDPRLKQIRHATNMGICEAQNTALCAASGEVIGFLDCDDYLAEEAVAQCMAHWRDDTVYLHSGRINIDENDQEINRIHFVSLPRQDYFEENLRAMYATHFKLIRRDAFARVGLFDPRFDSAQDYEMLMRIAFHYPSICFIHVPDFVYYHRLHPHQTTERLRTHQDDLTKQIQHEARLRQTIRNGDYTRRLSFVMLSYGKHTQTLKAIQGLEATVQVPHEIVLYDNGSDAETVAFLRREIDGRHANVKVIYGDRNLGPAQGRRAALSHAAGDWFIVFDNDEVPEPGWLEELLLRAEVNANVGAVCCRVAFPNELLQFSGGKVDEVEPAEPADAGKPATPAVIDLGLHDRNKRFDDLSACRFREVAWSPIGATLFTTNIAEYLHDGYPNVFEDAGVSFALKRQGLRLLNAPGALVWHDHITFRPDAEMRARYMADRYNPRLMLKSVASFYRENGLLIRDEYIWRENGLDGLDRSEIVARLAAVADEPTVFG